MEEKHIHWLFEGRMSPEDLALLPHVEVFDEGRLTLTPEDGKGESFLALVDRIQYKNHEAFAATPVDELRKKKLRTEQWDIRLGYVIKAIESLLQTVRESEQA